MIASFFIGFLELLFEFFKLLFEFFILLFSKEVLIPAFGAFIGVVVGCLV